MMCVYVCMYVCGACVSIKPKSMGFYEYCKGDHDDACVCMCNAILECSDGYIRTVVVELNGSGPCLIILFNWALYVGWHRKALAAAGMSSSSSKVFQVLLYIYIYIYIYIFVDVPECTRL